jgi:hypothetical protein
LQFLEENIIIFHIKTLRQKERRERGAGEGEKRRGKINWIGQFNN